MCYPDFCRDFILETDASTLGVGVVLAEGGKVHQVTYTSRSLSPLEKRYSVMELETLAVVWAVSHFHDYLYGHDVHIYTDHSAVKAIFGDTKPEQQACLLVEQYLWQWCEEHPDHIQGRLRECQC